MFCIETVSTNFEELKAIVSGDNLLVPQVITHRIGFLYMSRPIIQKEQISRQSLPTGNISLKLISQ